MMEGLTRSSRRIYGGATEGSMLATRGIHQFQAGVVGCGEYFSARCKYRRTQGGIIVVNHPPAVEAALAVGNTDSNQPRRWKSASRHARRVNSDSCWPINRI